MNECLLSQNVFPRHKSIHPVEVARALGVSPKQVYRWMSMELIGSIRASCGTGRTHRRIPVDDYDKFILHGGTQPQNGDGQNGAPSHQAPAHQGGPH